ncbi:MAG: hypothetical protein QNJ70_07495 [Xenococcaceae cyanobacterium MO_207.B15]|nr:hypothetical protein [Xenococcaceae cyanobacterium MO_207.B15]
MSSKGLRIGIETKIEYNPIFDVWSDKYESIRRTGLNDMQRGILENQIEKTYQSRFNLQWAWADSIATEVKQTYSQLTTAKKLNISRIKEQIKKKTSSATGIFVMLSKVKNPNIKQRNQALGLKSKLIKIQSLSERAPVCLVRPEDRARHPWTTWNRIARFLKSNKVRRSELFDWMKTLEKIAVRPRAVERRKRQFLQVGKPAQRTGLGTRTKTLVISDSNETGSPLSPASSQSNRIDGNSPCPNPKHSPTYVQRAFRFLVGVS